MHRIALSQIFSLASLLVVTIITSLAALLGRPISLSGTIMLLAIPAMFVFVLRMWQFKINRSKEVGGGFFIAMLFWIFIPMVVYLPALPHNYNLGLYLNWAVIVVYMALVVTYMGWSVLPHLIAAGFLQLIVYHYVLVARTNSHPLIVSLVGVCAAIALSLAAWALRSGVHRPTHN